MDAGSLLKSMLPMAVMLNTLNFEKMSWADLQEAIKGASQALAEHGDNILFRGPKKGDTAKGFNQLAKAITVLSFVPGGITFLGMHFEAVHPERLAAGIWLYNSLPASDLVELAKTGFHATEQDPVAFAGIQAEVERGAIVDFSEQLEQRGMAWNPLLLRVHSLHLTDIEKDPHSISDWIVKEKVSPFFIQVWIPQKKTWTEIREAVDQGYFENARTTYGKPGEIQVDADATPRGYASRYIEQFWPER
jgi:hypothetical protein